MEQDVKLLQEVKKLMIARYPRFATEVANANLQFKTDLEYHTAATDGKNIYFDPDFLASLSKEDKLFLIAHELMHIKFEHMFRMTDKTGKMRDPNIWNIATDAIINANLERDGFKIKEGYVNMPEALNYNSEEFYEKLLKDQKQENKDENSKQGDNSEQQSNNEQNQEQGTDTSKQFADDHSLWEKAFEESKQSDKKNNSSKKNGKADTKNVKLDPNEQIPEFEEVKFDEKSQFEENRKERRGIARQRFEKMKNEGLKKTEDGNIEFGDVGKAKPILDWKLLLKREIDKSVTLWSQRRSIAENNYAYRLEENDVEDEALTEVMIDTSGSVSDSLIINFLRQLKPLLKNSKLKAGCFDTSFYGFKEIKTERDINNFRIVGRGGTDFEEVVHKFTFKREVNKIVFTDGCDTMTLNDKKFADIIWIVYENKFFQPAVGKVIQISKRDLQNLSLRSKEKTNEDELTK